MSFKLAKHKFGIKDNNEISAFFFLKRLCKIGKEEKISTVD